MSEKQFVVMKLEILNEKNEWKGEYWWAVVNTKRVEDCFECRNKEVALKLCDFLNKATDDFKWQIRQKEEFKQEIKQYWKCRDKWKQEAKELRKENEQLKELLDKCRRVKLSEKKIKQEYAELNRKEREKHCSGDTTFTATLPHNEVVY